MKLTPTDLKFAWAWLMTRLTPLLAAGKARLTFMREVDKQGHFWAGATIALALSPVGTYVLDGLPVLIHWVAALAFMAAISVVKETWWDRKHGGVVDSKDAIATFLGGAVGATLHCFVLVHL